MNVLKPREISQIQTTSRQPRTHFGIGFCYCCFLHRKKKRPCVVLYLFGSALVFLGDMDLQLGLAVSRNSAKGFDLNCSGFDFKERCNIKKRSFYEAFDEENADDDHMPQTLPLLLWNDQPNRGEDQDDLDKCSVVINKIERDADGLVGWPPINPWRKRVCHQNRININCVTVENGGAGGGNGTGAAKRGKNSLYVKVKMEGVGIARKVDLSLHHSHESLLETLIAMFGKCQESIHCYLLTFQDKEGDWHLADDVPWRFFIGSVQRLKLQRKSD